MGTFFRQNAGLGMFVLVLAGSSLSLSSIRYDLKPHLPFFTKSYGLYWRQIRQFILPLKKKKKKKVLGKNSLVLFKKGSIPFINMIGSAKEQKAVTC